LFPVFNFWFRILQLSVGAAESRGAYVPAGIAVEAGVLAGSFLQAANAAGWAGAATV